MNEPLSNPATGRLSVQTVERLHRLLGGDVRVEGMILTFIKDRYGAATLLHLPPHVARVLRTCGAVLHTVGFALAMITLRDMADSAGSSAAHAIAGG